MLAPCLCLVLVMQDSQDNKTKRENQFPDFCDSETSRVQRPARTICPTLRESIPEDTCRRAAVWAASVANASR